MVSDNPETFADLDGHLPQDGPYNLETAEFSGTGQGPNCDYMGGDCSQKLSDDSGDEKFAILASFASYLSEVSSSVNGGKDLPYSAQQKKKKPQNAQGGVRLPPGANPRLQAQKYETRPVKPDQPPELIQTPNPTEPPPDVGVPGANNPGVPIGTVPGTTPEVNPENLTTLQKVIYVGGQVLRALAGVIGGGESFFIISTTARPGRLGCPKCPAPPMS